QAGSPFGPAEPLIHAPGIHDVVAVGAPVRCLEIRRSIQVADAQLGPVGHKRRSVRKTKLRAELDAIGRAGAGVLHAPNTWQFRDAWQAPRAKTGGGDRFIAPLSSSAR